MTPNTEEIAWVAERRPDVADPSGAATDRARLALMADISAATVAPRRRHRPGWRAGGLLAGAGLSAAAAVAVAVVLPGTGGPGVTPARHHVPAPSIQAPVVHGSPVLLRLASSLAQAPSLPGNATLVVHHNTTEGSSFSGDDLYEDNGDYYYGEDLAQLRQAVADPSQADATEGKIIAAAAASAGLTPEQAAQNIYAAAPVAQPSAASKRRAAAARRAARHAGRGGLTRNPTAVTQSMRDSMLWVNIGITLEGGAGRADVRAGALLAASVLPDVTVTTTRFDGHAVLQVTNRQFSGGYAETYDLDPQTGVIVHFHGGAPGSQDGVDVTYRVTRVTTPSLDPAH